MLARGELGPYLRHSCPWLSSRAAAAPRLRPRLQQQLPELRIRSFIRKISLALIGQRFCGPTLAQN